MIAENDVLESDRTLALFALGAPVAICPLSPRLDMSAIESDWKSPNHLTLKEPKHHALTTLGVSTKAVPTGEMNLTPMKRRSSTS